MQEIKVLLVEDDISWQKAMNKYLNNEKGIVVVGTAFGSDEAVRLASSLDIDIVVMDINLSDNKFDGINAALEISKISRAKIIMLTGINENEVIIKSFTAGAVNFVRKENYRELISVIYTAYNRTSPFEVLLDEYSRMKEEEQIKDFSRCEREVYSLIEEGLSRTQMQKRLHKSENTLKVSIRNILKKLNVKNTKEAVEKVKRKGLTD